MTSSLGAVHGGGWSALRSATHQPLLSRPPGARSYRRQRRACSAQAAADTTTQQEAASSATASSSAAPSSWPSDAARAAAYSTVAIEEVQRAAAAVRGRLPPWLRGAFLRNGPGNYDGMRHMFDGYALLAKVELDGAANAATASHRFLVSAAYRHFKATGGRMRWREVGTPRPHANAWEAVADVAQTLLGVMGIGDGVTDNASVSIVPQAHGRCLALTETIQGTYLMDITRLDTLRRVNYQDSLTGDITTAHPTVLPNGDLINFVSSVRLTHWVGGGFTLFRQQPTEPYSREVLARIPHKRIFAPSWVHDFPASQNHIVIPEMPLYFNLWMLLSGGSNENMFMDWVPQDGATIHVVSMDGKQVRSYHTPAFFCFHWVNAFESEDGRYLHIDGAVYEDPTIIGDLYLEPVRAGHAEGRDVSPSHYRRLTIDLHAPSGSEVAASWEPLVDDESAYGHFYEFPAISPAQRGAAYRYAYGACATRPTNAANSLVKFDNQARSCKVWHEPGALVGEPVFVPRPDGEAEDDGALLAMLSQADGSAALLVLDGGSFEEMARAELPYSLPNGFHGCWVPAEAMEGSGCGACD